MYSPRLKEKYTGSVVPALKEKFGYKNVMEIPKLVKISINQGIVSASSGSIWVNHLIFIYGYLLESQTGRKYDS